MAKKGFKLGSFNRVKMPTGTSSWLTNAGKSVGLAAYDVLKDVMPATAELAENSSAFAQDFKTHLQTMRSQQQKLADAMDSNIYKNTITDAAKDLMNSVKSGELYKQDTYDDDFDFDLGDDFDMGDDDFDSSFESDDGMTNVQTKSSKDGNVNHNVVQVNVDVGQNSDLVNSINEQTKISTNISQASLDLAKVNAANILQEFRAVNTTLNSYLGSMDSNIGTIATIMGTTVNQHAVISAKYYDDSMKVFNEINTLLHEWKEGSSQTHSILGEKINGDKYQNALDMFTSNGTIDPKAYFDLVKKQANAAMDRNFITSTIKMYMSDEDAIKTIFAHPMNMITTGIIKKLIPAMLKESAKGFDDMLKEFVISGLYQIRGLKNSSNPLLQFIGDTFGIGNKLVTTVNKGNYNKGKVDWNGQSHKTLNEVIPYYLRKMTAALTGTQEMGFDYEKGIFNTVTNMKEAYKKDDDRAMLGDLSSVLSDFKESVTESGKFVNTRQADRASKDMENLLLRLVKTDGSPMNRRGTGSFAKSVAEVMGKNNVNDPTVQLIAAYFDSRSPSEIARIFGRDPLNSRFDFTRRKTREENGELATNGMYVDNGDNSVDSHMRKNRSGKVTTTVDYNKSLLGGRDKYGKSSTDYLRNITQLLATGIKVYNVNNGSNIFGNQGPTPPTSDIDGLSSSILTDLKSGKREYDNQVRREDIDYHGKNLTPDEISRIKGKGDVAIDLDNADDGETLGKTMKEAMRSHRLQKESAPKSSWFEKLTGIKPDAPISKVVNAITKFIKKPSDALTDVFDKATNLMFKMVFGDDDNGKPLFQRMADSIKLQFTKISNWVNDRILTPLEEKIFGEDGLIEKFKQSQFGQDMKKYWANFRTALMGTKGENGEYSGGLLSETANQLKEVAKRVSFSLIDTKNPNSVLSNIKKMSMDTFENALSFFGYDKAAAAEKRADKDYNPFISAIDSVWSTIKDRGNSILDDIFGKSGSGSSRREFADSFMDDMKQEGVGGKVGAGAVIGGVSAAFLGGKVGFLSSLFLPGGFIGGALLGMGTAVISQSETLKKFLFGEQGEDGIREGGLVSKSVIDFVDQNSTGIKVGAFAGLAGSMGFIPAFFMPGGPVGGALIGGALQMAVNTETFQDFLYGKKDADGNRLSDGFLGKIKKLTGDESFKNTAIDAGIGAGVGFLGSFMIPGGPILNAMMGASAGIALNSEKFKTLLFGEKDDKGIRQGGLLKKATDYLLGPVKKTMQITNTKIMEWLETKIMSPFITAMKPVLHEVKLVKDRIVKLFKDVGDMFHDMIIKPVSDTFKTFIIDPIKDFSKSVFGGFQKIMGALVSAPFRVLQVVGYGLNRKHMRQGQRSFVEDTLLDAFNLNSKKREERKANGEKLTFGQRLAMIGKFLSPTGHKEAKYGENGASYNADIKVSSKKEHQQNVDESHSWWEYQRDRINNPDNYKDKPAMTRAEFDKQEKKRNWTKASDSVLKKREQLRQDRISTKAYYKWLKDHAQPERVRTNNVDSTEDSRVLTNTAPKVVSAVFHQKPKEEIIQRVKVDFPDVQKVSIVGGYVDGIGRNPLKSRLGAKLKAAAGLDGKTTTIKGDGTNYEGGKADGGPVLNTGLHSLTKGEYILGKGSKSDELTETAISSPGFFGKLKESYEKEKARKSKELEELQANNAKGSYASQKARQDAQDKETRELTWKSTITNLLTDIKDTASGFHVDWGKIFSKKGLLTSALLLSAPYIMKLFDWFFNGKWTEKLKNLLGNLDFGLDSVGGLKGVMNRIAGQIDDFMGIFKKDKDGDGTDDTTLLDNLKEYVFPEGEYDHMSGVKLRTGLKGGNVLFQKMLGGLLGYNKNGKAVKGLIDSSIDSGLISKLDGVYNKTLDIGGSLLGKGKNLLSNGKKLFTGGVTKANRAELETYNEIYQEMLANPNTTEKSIKAFNEMVEESGFSKFIIGKDGNIKPSTLTNRITNGISNISDNIANWTGTKAGNIAGRLQAKGNAIANTKIGGDLIDIKNLIAQTKIGGGESAMTIADLKRKLLPSAQDRAYEKWLYKNANPDDIPKGLLGKVANKIDDFSTSAKNFVTPGIDAVKTGINNATAPIKNFTDEVVGLGKGVGNQIAGIPQSLKDIAKQSSVVQKISGASDDIKEFVGAIGKKTTTGGAADDTAKGIGKIVTGTIGKMQDAFGELLKKFAKKGATEGASKGAGKLATFMGKIRKFLTPSNLATKSKKFLEALGKSANFIMTTGMTIFGIVDGATSAANLFQVDDEYVDNKMRAISAVYKGLINLSVPGIPFGAIIDIINELIFEVAGFNFITELAVLVYGLISSDEESNKLKEGMDKFKDLYNTQITDEYNQFIESASDEEKMVEDKDENGVGLGTYHQITEEEFRQQGKNTSFADFNAEKHQTLGKKMYNAYKDFKETNKNSRVSTVFSKDYWTVPTTGENGEELSPEEQQKILTKKIMQAPMVLFGGIFNSVSDAFTGVIDSLKTTVKSFKDNTVDGFKKVKGIKSLVSADFWTPTSGAGAGTDGESGQYTESLNNIAFYTTRYIMAIPYAITGIAKDVGNALGKVFDGAKKLFSMMTEDSGSAFNHIDGMSSVFKGAYWQTPQDNDQNAFSPLKRAVFYASRMVTFIPALAVGAVKDIGRIFEPIITPIKNVIGKVIDFDSDNEPDSDGSDIGNMNKFVYYGAKALAFPAKAIVKIANAIGTVMKPIIEKVGPVFKAFGEDLVTGMEVVDNPLGIFTAEYWKSPEGDDDANPMHGLRKVAFFGNRILLAIPMMVWGTLKMVFKAIGPILDTVGSVIGNIVEDTVGAIKVVDNPADIFSKEYWTVPEENQGEFGVLRTIQFYATRLLIMGPMSAIGAVKMVAKGIGKAFGLAKEAFPTVSKLFAEDKTFDFSNITGISDAIPTGYWKNPLKEDDEGLVGGVYKMANAMLMGGKAIAFVGRIMTGLGRSVSRIFKEVVASFENTDEAIDDASNTTNVSVKNYWKKPERFTLFSSLVWYINRAFGAIPFYFGKIMDKVGSFGKWISNLFKVDDEEMERRSQSTANEDEPDNPYGGNGPGYGGYGEPKVVNNMTYYSQNDPAIKNKPYALSGQTSATDGDTMSNRGCGPTSMAMVASQLTQSKLDPTTMAKLSQEGGYSTENGTEPGYFNYAADKLGLSSYNTKATAGSLINSLVNGSPVILQGRDDSGTSPYTSSGHYVVATGIDGDRIMVNDPRGKNYSKEYSLNNILKGSDNMWSFGGADGEENPLYSKYGGYADADMANGFPFYLQGDSRWGSHPYPYKGKGTVSSSGCGPTSMAMILKSFGIDTTPDKVADWSLVHGHRASVGSYWTLFPASASANGFTGDCLGTNTSSVIEALQNNKPVVASMKPGPHNFTKGGHFIVMSGMKDGKIMVNDPASTEKTNTLYPTSILTTDAKQFWSFNKNGKGSINNAASSTSDSNSSSSTDSSSTSSTTGTKKEGFTAQTSLSGVLSAYASALTKPISEFLYGKSEEAVDTTADTTNDTTTDSTASNENSTATTAKSSDGTVPGTVWSFFKSKGFSDAATAGIMGNIYQESKFEPSLIQGNGSGPAAGIFQWENYNTKSDRWKSLNDYANSKGKQWTDLQTQLEYALNEINGSEAWGFQKFGKTTSAKWQQSTDPILATTVFERSFERAGKPMMATRTAKAKEYYDKYKGTGGSGGFGTGIANYTTYQKKPSNSSNDSQKSVTTYGGYGENQMKSINRSVDHSLMMSGGFGNNQEIVPLIKQAIVELQGTNQGINKFNDKELSGPINNITTTNNNVVSGGTGETKQVTKKTPATFIDDKSYQMAKMISSGTGTR